MSSAENGQHPAPAPVGHGKVRIGLIVGVAVLGALFLVGTLPRLRNRSHLAALAQEVRTNAPTVQVVTPHLASASDLLLPGNIQAIEEAVIAARTSGYVRKRYADIGSRVKAGQVLAEIESPEVDQQLIQAQADTAKSQATVGQSQADVARLKASVAQTMADVARQRAGVKQARAQLASTQAKLAQAQAAEATAEAKLEQSRHAVEVQRATLGQANAQLELATATVKRYDTLYKEGFVSRQEDEQQQATLKTTSANVQAVQSAISAAQADVQAAQADVKASQAVVQSVQSDVEASKENVSAAEAALASTQATVTAAQSSVDASQSTVQANRAAVGSSQANAHRYAVLRSFEKVVAPFDGVITSRNVDTGALVKADTDSTASSTTSKSGLFGIVRTDVLRIQVNVPQTFMNTMRPGQKANVLVREFPGKIFVGMIFQSAGALDAASRTLLTEVHLDNRDNALKPGMYAQVQFAAADARALPRIPANTLTFGAEGTRVVTVTPEGKIHYVLVQLGRDFGTEVEVAQGLKGDEKLVANPSEDLKEGVTVHTEETPPTPKP